MKNIFVYAGQGSQKVGMGEDLYKEFEEYRRVVDEAKLAFDARELMANGPIETLSDTRYTQPCMGLFAAGVTEVLRANGIVADAACGLSLGEYGALYAAGVFDTKTYVELLAFRGNAMANAAEGHACAMSAVLGMEADVILEACAAVPAETGYVTVANYNCPGQYVMCGDEPAVEAAEALLRERGAKRCVRLAVSGPFHTKYMAPAGEALREYLSGICLRKADIPVYMNATGEELGDGDVTELLVRQVQSSVRLEDSLRKLLAWEDVRFIEIGPGATMAGFLKKTARAMGVEVSVRSIDTAEDLKRVLEEV